MCLNIAKVNGRYNIVDQRPPINTMHSLSSTVCESTRFDMCPADPTETCGWANIEFDTVHDWFPRSEAEHFEVYEEDNVYIARGQCIGLMMTARSTSINSESSSGNETGLCTKMHEDCTRCRLGLPPATACRSTWWCWTLHSWTGASPSGELVGSSQP